MSGHGPSVGYQTIQCIRKDESAQAVHVAAGSLVDIIEIMMKRDMQTRDDDVDCWQAWAALYPRPRGRTRRFGCTVCYQTVYVDVCNMITSSQYCFLLFLCSTGNIF
ncbi:hypothetical protein Y032_0005g2349 [Ancylostoma ceylanicum]|uniref:Uncharacterized protein n=1 Tax=Ancylostoma ceylanicum TaxID=53326 RepID=A0A016VR91_9BILA|nr:hypothetical protein Y032_0005g2349 [Ancylostoma ceylanicum]